MGKIFAMADDEVRKRIENDKKRAEKERRRHDLEVQQALQRAQALREVEERLAMQRASELSQSHSRSAPCVSAPVVAANEVHCSVTTHRPLLKVIPDFGGRMEQFIRSRITRPVRVSVSDGPAVDPSLMNRPLTIDETVGHLVEKSITYLANEPRALLHAHWKLIRIGDEEAGLIDTNICTAAVIFVDRDGFLHYEWKAFNFDMPIVYDLVKDCSYRSRAQGAKKRRLQYIARAIDDSYRSLYRSVAPDMPIYA